MKKLLILLISMYSGLLIAQPDHGNFEEKKKKMDAMKVAYLTSELDLSTDLAQKFWPVYNELDKQIDDLRLVTIRQMREHIKAGIKIEDISDDELEKMMLVRLKNDEKIAQLKMAYHKKFIDVLGIKKTAQLYHAEMTFARDLMRRSRDGKRDKERPRPED